MAYVEVDIDVNDIEWAYESTDDCENAIDEILLMRKEVKKRVIEKLKIPQVSERYATRKAIEILPLEKKVQLYKELFSDLLPNEKEIIKELLT